MSRPSTAIPDYFLFPTSYFLQQSLLLFFFQIKIRLAWSARTHLSFYYGKGNGKGEGNGWSSTSNSAILFSCALSNITCWPTGRMSNASTLCTQNSISELKFGCLVCLVCRPVFRLKFPYYNTRSAMRISLSRFPLMVTRLPCSSFHCFHLCGSKYEQEKLRTMIAHWTTRPESKHRKMEFL